MPHIRKNRVLESTTTTGTGPLTLAGPVTGFRAFSDVCAVGDTFFYFIEAVDDLGQPTGDYECGLGTYSAANELTRTTVLDSSNAGAVVSLVAGAKNVAITPVASELDDIEADIATLQSDVAKATLTSDTAKNLTGTSVSFTSIPSWVKRITITFSGLSLSGSSFPILRIGDAGGIENTAYTAAVAQVASGGAVSTDVLSTAFGVVSSMGASSSLSGTATLVLHDSSTNTWAYSGQAVFSSGTTTTFSGIKSLSATLTQVQFTTANGTDTFDAGTANIHYE